MRRRLRPETILQTISIAGTMGSSVRDAVGTPSAPSAIYNKAGYSASGTATVEDNHGGNSSDIDSSSRRSTSSGNGGGGGASAVSAGGAAHELDMEPV